MNTLRDPRNFAFNWRFTPTSRMTNELVVGQNRYDPIFGQPESLDKISFTGTPVDTTAQYYFGNSRVVSTWQVVDNFAYMRGAHAFKFGINLRRVREEDIRGSVAGLNAAEEVNFSTSINTVDPATFGLPADLNTAFDRGIFQSQHQLPARPRRPDRPRLRQPGRSVDQEHLPVRHALSRVRILRAGHLEGEAEPDRGYRPALRDPPLAEHARRTTSWCPISRWSPARTPSNTVKWVPGDLFKNQLGNIGPSLGFAWDPFKTGKTSIRANYRIAYDRINTFVIASTILPNLPGAAFAAINTDFGQNGGRLANLPALNPPTAAPSTLLQPAAFSTALQHRGRSEPQDAAHASVGLQHSARNRAATRSSTSPTSAAAPITCWAPTTSTRTRSSPTASWTRSTP